MGRLSMALAAAVARAVSPGAQAKSAKTDTTVVCKDGTTAARGRGACSHHGGVDGYASSSVKKDAAPARREAKKDDEAAAPSKREVKKDDRNADAAQRRDSGENGSGSFLGRLFGKSPATTPRDTSGGAKTAPRGAATARCKDGSLSYSQHRSGTCSGHGGVGEWLKSP